MSEPLDKGGPGIDTDVQRSKIEYTPDIGYVRETRVTDVDLDDLSMGYKNADSNRPSLCIYRLNKLKKAYQDMHELIEPRLKDDVVFIEDEPVVSDAISSFTNGKFTDRITFDIYKSAIDKAHSDSNAATIVSRYEEYHSGPDGKTEAELYRVVSRSEKHWKQFSDLTFNILTGSENPSEKQISRVKEEEEHKLSKWADLERERTLARGSITRLTDEGKEDSVEAGIAINTFNSATKDINNLRDDPKLYMSSVSSAAANDGETQINNMRNIVMSTISNTFDDMLECFIIKIIKQALAGPQYLQDYSGARDIINELSVSQSREANSKIKDTNLDTNDIKSNLDQSISQLKSIRVLLRAKIFDMGILAKSPMGILLQILEGPINELQSTILRVYSDMKSRITSPVMDWLYHMSNDEHIECNPYEVFAEMVLDVVDEVDGKFKRHIMDLFKLTKQINGVGSDFLSQVKEKSKIRDTYQVLDKLIQGLENVRNNLDNLQVNSLDELARRIIKSNGWDISYDKVSRTIRSTL